MFNTIYPPDLLFNVLKGHLQLINVHLTLNCDERSEEMSQLDSSHMVSYLWLIHTPNLTCLFKALLCIFIFPNVFPMKHIYDCYDLLEGQSDLGHATWMDLG